MAKVATKGSLAKKTSGRSTKTVAAAKVGEKAATPKVEFVHIKVMVRKSTRDGLNRLRSQLGMPSQAAVLDKLIKDALAAARAR